LKVLSGIFTFSTQRTLSKGLGSESIYTCLEQNVKWDIGKWGDGEDCFNLFRKVIIDNKKKFIIYVWI
jgi:hypothetical protein